MSLFKSNKNKTASAATTPAQTPRTSLNEQRPTQAGTKMTRDQALETALSKAATIPPRFSNIIISIPQNLPQLEQVERFHRFKVLSVDTGALSPNVAFIRSLGGLHVEWLDVFAPEACLNLVEVDIGRYRSFLFQVGGARVDYDDYDVDEVTVSELSRTLGMFLRGQSDKLRKLTVGCGILCCENDAKALRR
ncbi:hypothetical protein BGX29_004481 [Mortierella sp. GBA35]|nr:hypothetical protein BGX29_004481 [Mortierella sp. GBA35]